MCSSLQPVPVELTLDDRHQIAGGELGRGAVQRQLEMIVDRVRNRLVVADGDGRGEVGGEGIVALGEPDRARASCRWLRDTFLTSLWRALRFPVQRPNSALRVRLPSALSRVVREMSGVGAVESEPDILREWRERVGRRQDEQRRGQAALARLRLRPRPDRRGRSQPRRERRRIGAVELIIAGLRAKRAELAKVGDGGLVRPGDKIRQRRRRAGRETERR